MKGNLVEDWLNSVAYFHSQSKATEDQYKRVWERFSNDIGMPEYLAKHPKERKKREEENKEMDEAYKQYLRDYAEEIEEQEKRVEEESIRIDERENVRGTSRNY